MIPLPLPPKVIQKKKNRAVFEVDLQKAELKVKKEGEVTGADFKCPSQMKLVNPDLRIATITDKKTELNIEITVQKGIGYVLKEQIKSVASGKPEIGSITIDAIFTPIKNVNFKVENMRVGDRTDFDKLSLEIETDGTINPEEAFFEACDILIRHFNVIFQGKPELPASKAEGSEIDQKPKPKAKKTAKKTSKKAKK